MKKKAIRMLVFGFLVVILAGCAATDVAVNSNESVKLDYQSLLGNWKFTFPDGVTTLVINKIAAGKEGKISLKGVYKPCPPSCVEGKGGMKFNGTISPNSPRNLELVLTNGSKLDLTWNGGDQLFGFASLQGWSGQMMLQKTR